MGFYKIVDDGYIALVGYGPCDEQISELEYKELLSVIRSCPNAEGKGYRLRTDLTWEEYDLPVTEEPRIYTEDELEAMTSSELSAICEGFGFTGSMNKAVMVYLILHAQAEG